MSTVCLFDIDGTLLSSGGAGQHAMEQALLTVFQVTGPYEDIPAAGRTDRAITTDLFQHHRIDPNEENWKIFLKEYIKQLPLSLAMMKGSVLPGIVELLDELSNVQSLDLGLLTGNFREGAELKLKHYQLDHHFSFGGYGDDDHDRDDVARRAMADASCRLQREIEADSVWVIGDTPADVKCGRAIGARVIAVATGLFSYTELKATEPDLLFDNFADVAAVLDCLVTA